MLDISAWYSPTVKQLPIHQSKANTKVIEAARRSGKSRAAFGELLLCFQDTWNRTRPPSLIPAFHAWIIVPTDAQGLQTWNELQALFPKPFIDRFDQGQRVLYLLPSPNWNGGFGLIELKSSFIPETLQSAGLDFLWMNEAHDISERAFEKALPSTRSPQRLGRRLYEGIPSAFPDHWFRKTYIMANKYGHARDMFAYKMTYLDNPLLTKEQKTEIEGDRDILSEATWKRMYLAEYSEAAAFFRNVDDCIAGDLLPSPVPGHQYVAGFDIGLSVDPSEVFILDADERRVVHWQEWDSGVSWIQQRENILALNNEWHFDQFVFDASALGGKMAEQEFADTMLPAVPFPITSFNRNELLERLAGAILRNTITFPSIKPLIRQLKAMESRKTKMGYWRLDVPDGEHDDCIFALALGLTACSAPSPVSGRRGLHIGRRYLPTHEEAVNGGMEHVPETVRRRREARWEVQYKRLEEAGIKL